MSSTPDAAGRFCVRLDRSDRDALATIARAISTPHRRPATMSEALRAALTVAAATLASGAAAIATAT